MYQQDQRYNFRTTKSPNTNDFKQFFFLVLVLKVYINATCPTQFFFLFFKYESEKSLK